MIRLHQDLYDVAFGEPELLAGALPPGHLGWTPPRDIDAMGYTSRRYVFHDWWRRVTEGTAPHPETWGMECHRFGFDGYGWLWSPRLPRMKYGIIGPAAGAYVVAAARHMESRRALTPELAAAASLVWISGKVIRARDCGCPFCRVDLQQDPQEKP